MIKGNARLFAKFTAHAKHALVEAARYATAERAHDVTVAHMLRAIVSEKGSLGHNLLRLNRISVRVNKKTSPQRAQSGSLRDIPFDATAQESIKKAAEAAAWYGKSRIGTEHLLLGIFQCAHVLKDKKSQHKISRQLLRILEAASRTIHKEAGAKKSGMFPALEFFCENLTKKAREETPAPFWGREKELARVMSTLLRKNKNNPLLVGEAGVGKTAIVAELAAKIARGETPSELSGKEIFSLDVGMLVAGTMFRGDFEARLKDVIEEAQHENVIVFIDELHTIVGAGNAAGSLDLANMLKPALAHSRMRLIAATTPKEYKESIEKDAALARRFQPIAIAEESEGRTLTLLSAVKASYEQHHGVRISHAALESAVAWSKKYQTHRKFPDKALDLLDETASRLRMRKHSENEPLALEAAHIKETLEDILGAKVLEDSAHLADIALTLAQHVAGQGEALEKISEAVTRAQAGFTRPERPRASFLFLGPSGVGKTETAKALSRVVFGESHSYAGSFGHFIRMDMSEFQEPHSVSRLLGAPPGYVGFEQGGWLTEKVKHNPYALILFDEIEKAHPQVFNILLQILDEGTLTDASGEHINFKNTFIVLTSNIGTEEFNKKALGFLEGGEDRERVAAEYEAVRARVLGSLKETMRPELLNRLDHIVTFLPLSRDTLLHITKKQLNALGARLLNEKGVVLEIDETAVAALAEESKSDNEGARLVARVIAKRVEYPLAQKLLKGELVAGSTARIRYANDSFSVETKK